jgi:hypothetical protein
MTNTAIKTYLVGVVERAIAYYKVEAQNARTAAENWQDGEFDDRDDEALESEGPCNVRVKQPNGSWRKVAPAEWEAVPEMDRFTDFEIEPRIRHWEDGNPERPDHFHCEEHEADMWRLYGTISGRNSACIGEYDTRALAEEAYAGITGRRYAQQADSHGRIKRYSVLLLYPDYANDGGAETYYAFVEATDAVAAVDVAQRQATAAQAVDIDDPTEFAPLLVTEGHHYGEAFTDK